MNKLNGKRLLIQGAGRGNLGLIKTARKHGVYTIITGLGGEYPCNPYADSICYADISDPEMVLKVAKDYKVDGAIICCSDTGLHAIGRCNDILGLSGLSEESAIVSSNKYLMKERLVSNQVRTARYYKVCNHEELLFAAEQIKFPVIIKAIDLQGSRGINIVNKKEELIPAFDDVMSMTRQDHCIIEEFLIGTEFGAQAFIYDNNVLFVLPHGDETVMCKTAVPVGHYMPYQMSEELYKDTCLQVIKAIKALGFNNCAVNVDLIEKDGKAYIIELTGRVGANCLPELTSNYFGIDYYEMILRAALGESPLEVFSMRKEPTTTLARMIRLNHSGIVNKIEFTNTDNCDIRLFIKVGDTVRSFTNCNDAVGEVIVTGKDMNECEELMLNVLSNIKIHLQ